MSDGLKERVKGGWGALVSRADEGAGRLRHRAREMRRPTALQHGLAARERGNLEAAFWLFAEEFESRPEDDEVALAYWNTAVDLQRVDIAARAGVGLIERHAATGDLEMAARFWTDLVDGAPDVLVAPTALARILPVLCRRLDGASDDRRNGAHALARRAMRHAVDPRNEHGLGPGVALRLFEDGREVNPEAARLAAQVALDSPHLHEAKRTRLRTWLEGGGVPVEATPLDPPLPPETAADLKVIEAAPVELVDDGLLLMAADERRSHVAYKEIEAVSVAEVADLADVPVAVIDLILNWTRRDEEPLEVVRMRSDAFDPAEIVARGPADGGGLASMLGEILERSRAVPLPDPESALGLQLTRFDSLETYERTALRSG